MNKPIFSIVIPVYYWSLNLNITLRSIEMQSYKELKVLFLWCAREFDKDEEDYSEKNFKTIKSLCASNQKYVYAAYDSAIDGNLYTFALANTSGEYLAFINAGDRFSINYFFTAELTLRQKQIDLLLSECAVIWEGKYVDYYNADPFRVNDYSFENGEALKEFVKMRAMFWGWYFFGNKIISSGLLQQCAVEFDTLAKDGYSFARDLLCSAILYKNADYVVNTHHEYYALDWQNDDAMLKHFIEANDFDSTVEYFKQDYDTFLDYINADKDEQKEITEFIVRKFWHRQYWIINKDESLRKMVEDTFDVKNLTDNLPDEYNFYERFVTPLYPKYLGYEDIVKAICDRSTEYVIFDCFDTLVQRPFWYPTDLFELLEPEYNRLYGDIGYIQFSILRREAEKKARERQHIIKGWEDINIHQIYDYIHEVYGVDKGICEKIKELEISLELKYNLLRESGYNLYQLAKYQGKKLLVLSDMYLTTEVIDAILTKNGYTDHETFVSSQIHVSKFSGNIYKYILTKLDIEKPETVMMIGDNYRTDFENPKKFGMKAFHFPRAVDIFAGYNLWFTVNGLFKNSLANRKGCPVDLNNSFSASLITRCLCALSATQLFDFPFISWREGTDYNLDARLIGTFPFGLFLLSFTKWVADDAAKNGVGKLHFVSRDGYVMQKAYDIVKPYVENAPESHYLLMSRYIIAPLYVQKPENILEIFSEYEARFQSAFKIVKILKPIIPQKLFDESEAIFNREGLPYYKQFDAYDDLLRFVKIYSEFLYDSGYVEAYRQKARTFYNKIIKSNDYLVDVGYRQRVEFGLSKLLQYNVPSYTFHKFESIPDHRIKALMLESKTFFPFDKLLTFLLLELYFVTSATSIKAIDYETGEYAFGTKKEDILFRLLAETFQKNALNFISDSFKLFNDDVFQTSWDYFLLSMPLEGLLSQITNEDLKLFSQMFFDNEYGEEDSKQNVAKIWDTWRGGGG
jgi:FMN phosphatase YigB (HAD superfamily)